MDSYLPRQISQSDCEISSNFGKKCVFFSERELKKELRDTFTRAAWTLINNGKLAKQISSNCGEM